MSNTRHEGPSVKQVLIGIGATVVVTALCLVIAAVLSHNAEEGATPSERGAVFDHPIHDNDAGVRQRLILSDHPAYLRQRAQRDRLQSLGWIDEQHTRAHIPIDVAMDMVVVRAQHAEAPTP